MDGHEDDPSVGVAAPDQHGGLDPVEARHGDVGDDRVGRESRRGAHEGVAILDERDHVEVGLQQLAQLPRRLLMVVGQQHPGAAHAVLRG